MKTKQKTPARVAADDRNDRRNPERTGFTLLEVLLVLIILSAIAALVVPRLTGSQERAMILETKTRIKQLEAKIELYAIEHDAAYPETLEALLQPVDRDGKPMQAYEKQFPQDAWQQSLNYELEETQNSAELKGVRIWSNGPDRQNDDGLNDDINNWSEDAK